MQNDDIFEPFILVIPDVARGEERMFYEMDKVYKWALQRYDRVFKSYDEKRKVFWILPIKWIYWRLLSLMMQ